MKQQKCLELYKHITGYVQLERMEYIVQEY